MKLATYEKLGEKGVGVIKGDSVISLNRLINQPELTMIKIIERGLSYVKEMEEEINASTPDFNLNEVKLLPPLERPRKVVCVGNNYMDHCREQGIEPPESPMIFSKWPSCVIGYKENILLPEESKQVDYEAELGVIFEKKAKNLPESQVLDYVFGYLAVNDVSARDVQFEDGQWVRGKSFDTFLPTGPYIVTADEIKNPHDLSIRTTVNGEVLQDSNTKEMIFDIPYTISYLSKGFTFEAGDLIATGTPHGVGVFREPKVFLKNGDTVSIEIEGLGKLQNLCRE